MDEYEDIYPQGGPQGALAQTIAPATSTTVPSAPLAAVPAAKPEPSEYEKATAAYQQQRMQLIEQQKKLIESLEARVGGPSEMLFALAQGFSAPSRTGSFGESLGHATQALGAQQAQSRQAMSDIAKMRAEMAAQQVGMAKEDVELAKKNDAFSLIGKVLGVSPQEATQSIGGVLNPTQAEKLILAYPQIARLDKETGNVVKNAFEMTTALRKEQQEDIKNGLNFAELRAKYPSQILQFIPPDMRAKLEGRPPSQAVSGQPSAIAAPATTAPSTQISPDVQAERDRYAAEIRRREQTGEGIPTNKIIEGQPAAQQTTKPPVEENQLSIVDQAKLIAERAGKRDEEFKPQRASIMSWDPGTLDRSNSDLHDLAQIANKHPKIFNVLGGNGYFEALAKAANEGVQAGRLGTFSLPTADFVRSITLNKEEKAALARVQQILGNQFFLNAKDNKSVLGPQISNSDVMLLKAPLASVDNPAPFIVYWAQQNTLLNNQRKDIHKSFMNYEQKAGQGSPLGSYFYPQGPLYSILDTYSKDYDALNKRQPYYKAK